MEKGDIYVHFKSLCFDEKYYNFRINLNYPNFHCAVSAAGNKK